MGRWSEAMERSDIAERHGECTWDGFADALFLFLFFPFFPFLLHTFCLSGSLCILYIIPCIFCIPLQAGWRIRGALRANLVVLC